MRRVAALLPAPLAVLLLLSSAAAAAPTNVILMIGDGMGPEHEEAARLFSGGALAWDAAPNQALMTSDSLSGVTDSAASASAIATGQKYFNFGISQDLTGAPQTTSLEIFQSRGASTGLVTTSYIEDATTAAFGAHAAFRFLFDDITSDYLNDSRPNLLLGGVNPGDAATGPGMNPTRAAAAGYDVATTRSELLAFDPVTNPQVSGQFGIPGLGTGFEWEYEQGIIDTYDTVPFLSEMTGFALDYLEEDPDGFFLVIEQENIDIAGHLPNSDPDKLAKDIAATLEFSQSVEQVLDWIMSQPDPSDTLLIVTADHETGGLDVTVDNGVGNLPGHTWLGSDHTDALVNVYAWGENAEMVAGTIDNTDLFGIVTAVPEPGTGLLLFAGALVACRVRRS